MAATDETRLIVSLEAKIDQFEKKLDRATGSTNTRMGQIEKRFVTANARISRSMTTAMSASVIANQKMVSGMSAAGVAAGAAAANINALPTAMKGTTQAASGMGMALGTLGALAGAFAVRGAQQLIDASIRIENALKVAGLSGEGLTKVYDRLFAAAQQNAAPVEALVQLYSRASLVQKELGASTEDMLNFTDKVAVALRVSGRTAAESSGALLQLSQALGSGIVRAEEFNSILEGALPIAQAAAAGLTEAGGSVAKLRKLVVDGKVSSQAFFRAFEAGSITLEQKVAGAELTVSQGFVRLQNVLIDTAGGLDSAVGASNLATDALGLLADALKFIGDRKGPVVSTLRETTNNVNDLAQAARDFWNDPSARNAMNLLFGTGDKKVALPNFAEAMKSAPKRVKPVSLSDYPDVAKSGEEKRTNFEREVDQIKKRTEALRAELGVIGQAALAQDRAKAAAELRAALDQTIAKEKRKATKEELASIETLADAYAALNVKVAFLQKLQSMREDNADLETEIRLTGLYGAELEKARVQQELLVEAKRKGVEVTPQLQSEIDAIAERNAKRKETQQIIEDTRATARDALSGFIKDMRDGTSATESLGNALSRISDKLIDMGTNALVEAALGPLARSLTGGGDVGLGSWAATILGAASGGKVSGPGTGTSDSIPARLSNGEYVVNARATRQHQPMLEAINAGKLPKFAAGGPVSIPSISVPSVAKAAPASSAPPVVVNATFNVANGTAEGVEKLKTEIVPLIRQVTQSEIANLGRKNRFGKMGF